MGFPRNESRFRPAGISQRFADEDSNGFQEFTARPMFALGHRLKALVVENVLLKL